MFHGLWNKKYLTKHLNYIGKDIQVNAYMKICSYEVIKKKKITIEKDSYLRQKNGDI